MPYNDRIHISFAKEQISSGGLLCTVGFRSELSPSYSANIVYVNEFSVELRPKAFYLEQVLLEVTLATFIFLMSETSVLLGPF